MASYFTFLAMLGILVQIYRYTDFGIILYVFISIFTLSVVATIVEPTIGTENATIMILTMLSIPECLKMLRSKLLRGFIAYCKSHKTLEEKIKLCKFIEKIALVIVYLILIIIFIHEKIVEIAFMVFLINHATIIKNIGVFIFVFGVILWLRQSSLEKQLKKQEVEKEENKRKRANEEEEERKQYKITKEREDRIRMQEAKNRAKELEIEENNNGKQKINKKTNGSIEEIQNLLDD